MKRIISSLVLGGMLVAMLGMFATAPSFADARVYIRFGDGRVVYVPHSRADYYTHHGAVIVGASLPSGYVNETYSTWSGYPVYYQGTYWHNHHRYWHGDTYRHDHDNGRDHEHDRDHH